MNVPLEKKLWMIQLMMYFLGVDYSIDEIREVASAKILREEFLVVQHLVHQWNILKLPSKTSNPIQRMYVHNIEVKGSIL